MQTLNVSPFHLYRAIFDVLVREGNGIATKSMDTEAMRISKNFAGRKVGYISQGWRLESSEPCVISRVRG